MSHTREPRLSTIVLALSAAIVAGVSLVAAHPQAVGQQVVQPAFAAEGIPPSLPSKAHPAVLFIGDSYTQGPTTPDLSYGYMSATEMGWECNVAAQPGTGYINGGPGHRLPLGQDYRPSTSFLERLPRLRELYRADIVILDGGRNDVVYSMSDVMPTVLYTVSQVIDAWPNSRIVVIAPWFLNELVIRPPTLEGRTVGEEFLSALRSSPEFDKVDLIDPGALGWFTGTDVSPYVGDDGIHPNFNGAKRIADLLTAALISEGFASPS
ncbi:SGNH/GDSL hydrolase family protein [Mycobacterium sp. 21AC1]|uniref:SGNH/GDSL hydrolase family protein n=1 Tax=[Mycobacterium] appelbergii TaxID=2939269 RepID=UPI002939001B|nr:SGNH/GDSL hydrolase family protein [Mycobacterium sp. 21AC1]MDV3128672.1 SGNH/GDSL hydrolase family protein [Mycobacterium sp. 21AC1]